MNEKMKKLDVDYDFVAIIDLLSEKERTVYKITSSLEDYLSKEKIEFKTKLCKDKSDFKTFLKELEIDASTQKFMLHFVAHGDEDCIGFKETNVPIFWEELAELLVPINKKLKNTLILNMTSCFGLHGIKINLTVDGGIPFFGLIGASKKLGGSISKQINEKFYSKLIEGKEIFITIKEIGIEIKKSDLIYCISSEGFDLITKYLK